MKKLLFFIVIAMFAFCANAQVISTFPWTEDFENDNFSDDDWLDAGGLWEIATVGHVDFPLGPYSGSKFAYFYSHSEEETTSVLETYAFSFPGNTVMAKLSFWFANPAWEDDVDQLSVGYRHSIYDEYTPLQTWSAANDQWRYVEICLPIDEAHIQIQFKATTGYSFGIYLDNIKVEIITEDEMITSFPWCEDFESGNLDQWAQYYDYKDLSWQVIAGSGHPSGSIQEAHSGNYNAAFTISGEDPYSKVGSITTLISPVLDLVGAQEATLTFSYANEEWDGDLDQLVVYYRTTDGKFTYLDEYTTSVAEWTTKTITLPGNDQYQIAFEATTNYGFGILLDDICVEVPTGVEENESVPVFSVYPNPANDYITVNRTGNDEIFIYNAMGSLVKSSNENHINISNLAPGFYTVKSSEGTAKIVVE